MGPVSNGLRRENFEAWARAAGYLVDAMGRIGRETEYGQRFGEHAGDYLEDYDLPALPAVPAEHMQAWDDACARDRRVP